MFGSKTNILAVMDNIILEIHQNRGQMKTVKRGKYVINLSRAISIF